MTVTHLRRFVRRIVTFFRANQAETDLAREMTAHLQLLEDQFVANGMSMEDARYAARRTFGGIEQAKELQRDARSFRWLAGWRMDLKLGLRMLGKSPGVTVVAVIALAVAFGAGATYLEFVNGLVRPSLSFPGGDRLVGIVAHDLEKNSPDRRLLHDFRRWRDELTLIENLGASQEIAGDVTTDDGRAEPVDGVRISAWAFRLMPAARSWAGRSSTRTKIHPRPMSPSLARHSGSHASIAIRSSSDAPSQSPTSATRSSG